MHLLLLLITDYCFMDRKACYLTNFNYLLMLLVNVQTYRWNFIMNANFISRIDRKGSL